MKRSLAKRRGKEMSRITRIGGKLDQEIKLVQKKLEKKLGRKVSFVEASNFLATSRIKKRKRGRPKDPLSFLEL